MRSILVIISFGLLLSCSPPASQRSSSSEENLSEQLALTKYRMTLADNAINIYGSYTGGAIPVNPLDNPHGSIRRRGNHPKEYKKYAQPWLQEACGFVPPDILPEIKEHGLFSDEDWAVPEYGLLYDPFSPEGNPFYLYSGLGYKG